MERNIFYRVCILLILFFVILSQISSAFEFDIDYKEVAERIKEKLKLVYCFFIAISSAVGVLIIALSGMEWLSSLTPENITRAKNRIIYALIALILISISCQLINILVESAGFAPVDCTCF
ncbi:MAG: hypothetical protein DRO95_01995 [Candidatus Altiarchaeales archaeon]|nr:MAG: hypothetical protein DRO95_01995 [Candidatus Altiarchaeales archaeon]